jgi:hypothetical protein
MVAPAEIAKTLNMLDSRIAQQKKAGAPGFSSSASVSAAAFEAANSSAAADASTKETINNE